MDIWRDKYPFPPSIQVVAFVKKKSVSDYIHAVSSLKNQSFKY